MIFKKLFFFSGEYFRRVIDLFEEVMPNLYKLEIPLPNSPLKAINSYIIKAGGRNLIVDTGMNREECKTVMKSGLQELGIDLGETDFFITHMHADHSGLVSELATDSSRVYCSQIDADVIVSNFNRTAQSWFSTMTQHALKNGFPEEELQRALSQHPGFKYSTTRSQLNFNIIKEGDIINVGDHHFHCLETPGHTRGHMCLYEPSKKILLSGDHVLYDITPNISMWIDWGSPLHEYLASLDKIYQLDIELVMPGHRRLFHNVRERIDELKHHHRVRANEVLNILKGSVQDAYQVSSQMTWDMTYKSWDQFPSPQKWFATGEAISHLKCLEQEQKIKREFDGSRYVFSPID